MMWYYFLWHCLAHRAFLSGNSGQGAIRYSLNNIVMVLRKICNHPFLVDGVEERTRQVSLLQLGIACICVCVHDLRIEASPLK